MTIEQTEEPDKPSGRRKTDVPVLSRTVTVGWVIGVTALVFVSVALIAWSVKENFEADRARQAEDDYVTCVAANDRRADAKIVALEDVAGDRAIWESIDGLFETGIPEPARSVVFTGLDNREKKIEETYRPTDCPLPESLEAEVTNGALGFG